MWRGLRAAYDLSVIEGELALEGAHAVDRLAALRRQRRAARRRRGASARQLELQWTKTLAERLRDLKARLDRRSAAHRAGPGE